MVYAGEGFCIQASSSGTDTQAHFPPLHFLPLYFLEQIKNRMVRNLSGGLTDEHPIKRRI
jgi:hypothetical protein